MEDSSYDLKQFVFHNVFPILGVLTGTFMSFALFRSVLNASRDGSLGDLNATPFVFMLGNCIGWIGYSFLIDNVYVFLPNGPALILAIWLNIQAIKLQYENYRSNELQSRIISALEEQAKKQPKKSFHKREVSDLFEQVITEDSMNFAELLLLPESTAPVVGETSVDTTTSEGGTTYSSIGVSSGDSHTLLGTIDETGANKVATGDETMDMVDYAHLIWDIAAQKTPAPASHELMVLSISAFWLLMFAIVGLGTSIIDIDTRTLMVGIAVNFNLIFFYGAPLSKISMVFQTRSSKYIHVPTMITSLVNGSLWFIYGLALGDYFVAVPNGLGAVLGVVQVALCILFPHRHHPNKTADGIVKTDSSMTSSATFHESTPLI